MAMATACFSGFPALLSVAMFSDITAFDFPVFSGMILVLGFHFNGMFKLVLGDGD
jgi:hypothetical protein